MQPSDNPFVLVVEDNEDVRLMLELMLSRHGLEVTTAADGAEALSLLRDRRPAVVVTDLRMPQLDGLELAQRARDDGSDIPFILLTAHGAEDDRVTAFAELTGTAVVPKGRIGELLDTVVRLIGRAP